MKQELLDFLCAAVPVSGWILVLLGPFLPGLILLGSGSVLAWTVYLNDREQDTLRHLG